MEPSLGSAGCSLGAQDLEGDCRGFRAAGLGVRISEERVGGAAQNVERSGMMIQRLLGGQTCGFWTLRPFGACGKDSRPWPVASLLHSSQL